ncbi:Plasma membrane t-SNARE, secretory vesicle fusion [Dinochytrium kinnereticum]|nr:Plasma membrane t-SNARE, secretory vesicle fusion [Dinochytrium kinnereticum]
MARNRLGEYRELVSSEPPADTIIRLSSEEPEQIEGLYSFLRKADEIQAIAQRLEVHTDTIKALNKRLEGESVPSIEDNLKDQIDTINSECKYLIQQGRDGIQSLKSSRGGDPQTRQTTFTETGRRFRSATQLYLQTETDVASNVRARFARQIKIVRPDATEEEVRQVVEAGGDLQSFLMQDVMQNAGVQRRMLREVEERKKALERILESVVELSRIVTELDAMITEQQQFVDIIETKVETTYANVVLASEELSVANKHAEGARNKQWYIFAIIGTVVLIIIIIIAIVIAMNSPRKTK